MNGDWIKVHRKLLKSAIGGKPVLIGCWIWLLLNANWEERQLLNGTVLLPGQLLVGMDRLAAEWDCSKTAAYRRLLVYEGVNMIRRDPGTIGTVITICNWTTYQKGNEEGGTMTERSGVRRGVREGVRGAYPEEEERTLRTKKGGSAADFSKDADFVDGLMANLRAKETQNDN